MAIIGDGDGAAADGDALAFGSKVEMNARMLKNAPA